MAEEMSFAEAEGLKSEERKERKEGEVAYSASSAVLDMKNIFFAPSQQKYFLTS